jgi:nitroreductase
MLGWSSGMDCIEALKTRRSTRAYTGEAVARETIEDIVDCGRLAATARNVQPWEFIVVTERAMLRDVAAATDYGGFIAQAAACIAVFCHETKYYLEDGCNASQNMLVAARAHGLGACWVAGDKKPYAERVRRMLGAPEGCKLISLLAIGHPAEHPGQEKRPLADVLHWERY